MPASLTRSDMPVGMIAESYEYYWERYDKLDPMYRRVFKVQNTTKAYEKSTSAVGTGLLIQKSENADIQLKTPIEG